MRIRLDIECETIKDERGRIKSHIARLHGQSPADSLNGYGQTLPEAIRDLTNRLRCSISGLGRAEVHSEPDADFHAITMLGPCGDFVYRHMDVINGRIALRDAISSGSPTFEGQVERMRAHVRGLTHRTCRLCSAEFALGALVRYATLTTTAADPGIDCEYTFDVCATCESTRGIERSRAELALAIPGDVTVWRIGPVASEGAHPAIPSDVVDAFKERCRLKDEIRARRKARRKSA